MILLYSLRKWRLIWEFFPIKKLDKSYFGALRRIAMFRNSGQKDIQWILTFFHISTLFIISCWNMKQKGVSVSFHQINFWNAGEEKWSECCCCVASWCFCMCLRYLLALSYLHWLFWMNLPYVLFSQYGELWVRWLQFNLFNSYFT